MKLSFFFSRISNFFHKSERALFKKHKSLANFWVQRQIVQFLYRVFFWGFFYLYFLRNKLYFFPPGILGSATYCVIVLNVEDKTILLKLKWQKLKINFFSIGTSKHNLTDYEFFYFYTSFRSDYCFENFVVVELNNEPLSGFPQLLETVKICFYRNFKIFDSDKITFSYSQFITNFIFHSTLVWFWVQKWMHPTTYFNMNTLFSSLPYHSNS